MSAKNVTVIDFKCTKEEFRNILKVIDYFTVDMSEKYRENKTCVYFSSPTLIDNKGRTYNYINEDTIKEYLDTFNGAVTIELVGPLGCWCSLSDARLFEALADTAPNAYFDGRSDCFASAEEISLSAELKNRKLYITNAEAVDVEFDDATYKVFKDILPYDKFCEIFQITDKEMFSEEIYDDFVFEAWQDGFPYMDYDSFFDCCPDTEIEEEEEYNEIIETVRNMGIPNYFDACEKMQKECVDKYIYDPITKTYA